MNEWKATKSQQLNRSTAMDMKHCRSPHWRAEADCSHLLSLVPYGLQSMSVHIINEEPVYVIPGSDLVLKAKIQHGPLEEVSMVTWEREPETGIDPEKVTLATCPVKSPKCENKRPNVHMSVEPQATTLEMNGYRSEDSGVYAVTVTDQAGAKTTAYCIVRIYGTVWYRWTLSQMLNIQIPVFPVDDNIIMSKP